MKERRGGGKPPDRLAATTSKHPHARFNMEVLLNPDVLVVQGSSSLVLTVA